MIISFSCFDTQTCFQLGTVNRKVGWVSVVRVARRKLQMIHAAKKLDDLKIPFGNKLHLLFREYEGYHAISVNDQWRVIFIFKEGNAYYVHIKDYH